MLAGKKERIPILQTNTPIRWLLWIFFVLMNLSFADTDRLPAGLQKTGIRFSDAPWKEILETAKTENKLVFVDGFASWCEPCRLLRKKTFPDKEVGALFNQYFVNTSINMEKGEGPALMKIYPVEAYPTLLITDANGKLLTYTMGYLTAKQLLKFGQYGISLGRK